MTYLDNFYINTKIAHNLKGFKIWLHFGQRILYQISIIYFSLILQIVRSKRVLVTLCYGFCNLQKKNCSIKRKKTHILLLTQRRCKQLITKNYKRGKKITIKVSRAFRIFKKHQDKQL